MDILRSVLPVVVVGLAACSHSVSEGAGPAPPEAVRPQPPLDAPANMKPDFVASTNEPFWQVRVEGKRVLLTGPEVRRELMVQSNDAMFDGRNVVATDAKGQVEVRVTPRLCQDSMSGAQFPYTARVTVDANAPVLGCARDP